MTLHLYGWTVYRYPHDFPGEIVARKWEVTTEGTRMLTLVSRPVVHGDVSGLTSEELEKIQLVACRAGILSDMPGATMIPRSPGDDPVILESWL